MRTAWFLPNHGNDSLPAFLGPLTSVIESRARTRPKLCLRKAGLCYRVPNKDSLQALPPHRFAFNKEHASDSLQALSSTLFSLVIANGLALSLVVGPLCFVIESRKQLSQSFLRTDWFSSVNSRKGQSFSLVRTYWASYTIMCLDQNKRNLDRFYLVVV
jgi:hypothetical protein